MKNFFKNYLFNPKKYSIFNTIIWGLYSLLITWMLIEQQTFSSKDYILMVVMGILMIFDYLPPMAEYRKDHPLFDYYVKHSIWISIILGLGLIIFF